MRTPAVAALAAGVLALAACSGEAPAPPPQSQRPAEVTVTPAADGSQAVDVDADDAFRFRPSLISARPGPLTVTLHHVGKGAPHNLSVDGVPGSQISLISPGQSKSRTFTVPKPGSYRFVCSIHVAQGQVGTLTVTAP